MIRNASKYKIISFWIYRGNLIALQIIKTRLLHYVNISFNQCVSDTDILSCNCMEKNLILMELVFQY